MNYEFTDFTECSRNVKIYEQKFLMFTRYIVAVFSFPENELIRSYRTWSKAKAYEFMLFDYETEE